MHAHIIDGREILTTYNTLCNIYRIGLKLKLTKSLFRQHWSCMAKVSLMLYN